MINLEEFVESIHLATAAAGEALIQKNLNLLDQFFEEADEDDTELTHMAENGRSDGKISGQRKSESTKDEHNSNTMKNNVRLLKPRMVAMQYPMVTKEGPSVQSVNVPLITLVPLSQVELQEMKFSSELELSVNGEALQVSFPKRTVKSQDLAEEGGSMGQGGKTKLEIKIASMETPDGLRFIVDGYERALRSQIPG